MIRRTSGTRLLVDARLPWGSGIGRYVANVLPLVADRLRDARIEVLVPESGLGPAQDIIWPTNVILTRSLVAPFSMGEQLRLPSLAREHDLCWFTNYWVPLAWRGRFVATVHDLLHLEPALFPASPLKRRLSQATFAKVARQAAALIAVSRYTERTLRGLFSVKAPVTVVHHGADHQAPVRGEAPHGRERLVLAVGAAKAHKNWDTLLRAWRLASKPPGWRLVVVSPDDPLRSVVDLGAWIDSADDVERRRAIGQQELDRLYASAAIVAVPSRYEGFGLPLIEGMQAGAVCVSSTAEALVEVAGSVPLPFVAADDLPGWVEALESWMRAVDAREPVVADLTALSRRRAAAFQWARAADRTADVLDAALRRGSPTGQ